MDMFFVLSGYLITTIITPARFATAAFSFLEFTIPRPPKRICLSLPVYCFARRSLPPFSFCLSICANTSNPPSAPCCFAANSSSLPAKRPGYFRMRVDGKPLQHHFGRCRWMNSFIFIFPALLILFFRISKRRPCGSFILLLIVSACFPALFADFWVWRRFFLHVRAGELLVGSLFAFIPPAERTVNQYAAIPGWLDGFCVSPPRWCCLRRPARRGEYRIGCFGCLAVGEVDLFGQIIADAGRGFNTSKLLSLRLGGVCRVVYLFGVFVALGGVLALMCYLSGRLRLPHRH